MLVCIDAKLIESILGCPALQGEHGIAVVGLTQSICPCRLILEPVEAACEQQTPSCEPGTLGLGILDGELRLLEPLLQLTPWLGTQVRAPDRHGGRLVRRDHHDVGKAVIAAHRLPVEVRSLDLLHVLVRHYVEPEPLAPHGLERREIERPPGTQGVEALHQEVMLLLQRVQALLQL